MLLFFALAAVVAAGSSQYALGSTTPESGSPTVWTQLPADKVRPGATPPVGAAASAELSAAQNEFEAVQIVVTGPATKVTASASGMSGPGAPIPMRLYRADIIDLQYASGPDGQTGKYPDALIPERDEFFNETVYIVPVRSPL